MRHHRAAIVVVTALLLATSMSHAAERPAVRKFPMAGEWGCYRRDGSQQARSPLKGRITKPTIAWKHYVGSIDTLIEVQPGSRDASVSAPAKKLGNLSTVTNLQRWGLQQPLAMIEGRRQPLPRGGHAAYADVLPDVPGLEKIEFESAFRASGVKGGWPMSTGWLKVWTNGKWNKVWQMKPIGGLFSANPIVGDFDNDGKREVAILPWNDLILLDLQTGAVKDKLRFTPGRSYGFFGVYDMDGDGRKEFLVMADFSKHIDVLGFRDGKLALLWQRDIEQDISNPQKKMRVNIDPAADVDGDGKLEVMLNLQNGKGDGRWYVTIFDGMTGLAKAEIADARLQGIVDIDGDGAAELLTVETNGPHIPDYGTIRIWKVKGRKAKAVWQRKSAAWQTWNRPMPAHVNSGATDGRRDVLWRKVGKLRVVVTWRRAGKGGVTIAAGSWKDGTMRPLVSATAPDAEGVAVGKAGNMLVRCRTAPGSPADVTVSKGKATVLVSGRPGVPAVPPVVVKDRRYKRPVIVVAGSGQQLVGFHAPSYSLAAHELWRVAGRAQGETPGSRGSVIADLEGDGRRQLLYATAAPNGAGRLVAMDLDGKEVWHHDIDHISGGLPHWNVGGVILWQTGHFTGKDRTDVLLTVRRSMMHSEETMLLSGRGGRRLWHRKRQIQNRGVGGTPFAIADCDGDGLDDAVLLHPNVYCILKGTTGANLLGRETLYWGMPVTGDFRNNGTAAVFFGTRSASATAVFDIDRPKGTQIWVGDIGKGPRSMPAFGDFTGGKRMQAMGLGYPDGVRCYDTATGKVLWRMPMPADGINDSPVSADIDSDGRDEVLFSRGRTLYCIGTDKTGKRGVVKWTLDLPAWVSSPVVADVDANGLADILVTGGDGNIYCVQ